MPSPKKRAGSPRKRGGKRTESEMRLRAEFTASALHSCPANKLRDKLIELRTIVGEVSDLDPDAATKALEESGFAAELMRDGYLNGSAAVQVHVGRLSIDLLELCAPNLVFRGCEKKLFSFYLRQIGQLEKAPMESEAYRLCFYITKAVARTRVLTLLSEAEGTEEQVNQLFDLCINKLGATSEDPALQSTLPELLHTALDDVQEVSEDTLRMMVAPLCIEGKKRNAGGNRVVKQLLRQLDEKLVSTLATHIAQRCDSLEEQLASSPHNARQVLGEFKSVLTAVMDLGQPGAGHQGVIGYLLPHFASKLAHESSLVRNVIAKCFGRLFEQNERLQSSHAGILSRLLERHRDADKQIRIWFLEWAARMVTEGIAKKEVKKQITEKVSLVCADADEQVRKSAVDAVCKICKADAGDPPAGALHRAVLRMRDKKPAVRKHCVEVLGDLYRDVVTANDSHIALYVPIPAALLHVHAVETGPIAALVDKQMLQLLPAPSAKKKADAGHSPLLVQLVKLWVELNDASRSHFQRFLSGKWVVREVLRRLCDLREEEGAEAKAMIAASVRMLNAQCGLPAKSGVESLLAVEDEKWWRSVREMACDPSAMATKHSKALDQLRAHCKGGDADRASQLKEVPDIAQQVLLRAAFPFDSQCAAELVDVLSQRWQKHDGTRCALLSELVGALSLPFRDVFSGSAAIRGQFTKLLTEASAAEADQGGWGSDEEGAGTVRGDGGKELTVPQRRALLVNMISTGKRLQAHSRSAGGLLHELPEKKRKAAISALRRVCLSAPHEVVKCAVQLLCALTEGTQKEKLLSELATEAFGVLKAERPERSQTRAALRALQGVFQLCPAAMGKKLWGPVWEWLTANLSSLAEGSVEVNPEHTFQDPPAACKTYRIAMKCFVAGIVACPKDQKHVPFLQECYTQLMGWLQQCTAQESALVSGVQVCDTVKACLRLARDDVMFGVGFGTLGPKKIWSIVAYTVMLSDVQEAKDEVGRKLVKALRQEQLKLQFAQLLVPLLHTRSKGGFQRARERLSQVIALARRRCAETGQKLDSAGAHRVCPEYILPPLVHLLSRWPDLAERRPSFEPLQKVLFVFFDEMTTGSDCAHCLFDFLRRIKLYDDAHLPKSTNTRLICDIAFRVLCSVTDAKEVKVRPFPGRFLMPKCFKDQSDPARAERNYLDEKRFVPLRRDQLTRAVAAVGAGGDDSPAKRAASASPKKQPPAKVKRTGAKRSPTEAPAAGGRRRTHSSSPDDTEPRPKRRR
eukprot:TRINITY_DN5152_c0_g1_i1.p1 TRINITY_DN5152_c0_g1~~TRINITY_DN5152_c0_g1_i1.p1  ORF type:complete len:1289 (+),score=529.47 TRINITY_DN5152_c0_g1_i1:94-3867(+)